MLKNILLITRRTLTKNKSYTFITIFGSTIGMSAFILISAYVNFEKSFDTIHPDLDNIYRVESSFYKNEQLTNSWPTSTNGYATALRENMPEIASVVRINFNNSERVVRYQNNKFREEHVCFADSNFFSFFAFPLIEGNPATVLKEANTVVISQQAAQKYFGNTEPVGKVLELSTPDGSLHCMVTGVFKDMPVNSTLRFNFLISWLSSPLFIRDFWYIHESYTFLKLKPGAKPESVENKFPALAERYKSGESMKDLKWTITLVPLRDIHLNSAKQYEMETKGNRQAVQYLGIIAFLVLLIACVNYINLSTAKAVDRSREVGIRKVNGAGVAQLLIQFLFESFVINSAALIFSSGIVLMASRLMPGVLAGSLSFGLLFSPSLFARIALIFGCSILLSGIYPALLLANLKPANVLKGKFSFSRSGLFLRKSLVAFQFASALILIAGSLAVYRQIRYMNQQQLGVNVNQTMVIKAPVSIPEKAEKIQIFKRALRELPGVTGVCASGAVPGREVGYFIANRRLGAPKIEERTYEMLKVDCDFIRNYDLDIVAGRAFDRNQPTDSTAVILNEAAVKQFGFECNEAAVGQRVLLETNEAKPNLVIGVIRDYHQQSLQQHYTAVLLFMDPGFDWIPIRFYSVKFNVANPQSVISGIKSNWEKYFPDSSLDWFFLDDFYNRQYQQDRQFAGIFLLFSFLAITIACLGLFGLTAYSAARRVKEIGIRKVLGASSGNIIWLLSFETVKVVVLASLFAVPLSYLFIDHWLSGYAFRAGLTYWQFLVPVLALLLLSGGTVSYMTLKAAAINPVKAIREE